MPTAIGPAAQAGHAPAVRPHTSRRELCNSGCALQSVLLIRVSKELAKNFQLCEE